MSIGKWPANGLRDMVASAGKSVADGPHVKYTYYFSDCYVETGHIEGLSIDCSFNTATIGNVLARQGLAGMRSDHRIGLGWPRRTDSPAPRRQRNVLWAVRPRP